MISSDGATDSTVSARMISTLWVGLLLAPSAGI